MPTFHVEKPNNSYFCILYKVDKCAYKVNVQELIKSTIVATRDATILSLEDVKPGAYVKHIMFIMQG